MQPQSTPQKGRMVFSMFSDDEPKTTKSMTPLHLRQQNTSVLTWKTDPTCNPMVGSGNKVLNTVGSSSQVPRTGPAPGHVTKPQTTTTTNTYKKYNFWAPSRALTARELEAAEERKKYTVPGTCGLKNMTNTCYMNSTIQCLNQLTMFRSMLFGEQKKKKDKIVYHRSYDKALRRNTIRRLLASFKKKDPKGVGCTEDRLPEKVINQAKRYTLTHRLRSLMLKIWRKNKTIRPARLRHYIRVLDEDFGTSRQQDAEELLGKMLDALHDEQGKPGHTEFPDMSPELKELVLKRDQAVKGIITHEEYKTFRMEHAIQNLILKSFDFWKRHVKKSTSMITKLFTGLYMSVLECIPCKYLSGTFEPFNIMSVPIPEHGWNRKLVDSLGDFSKCEMLTGGNQWMCPRCDKKVNARKTMLMFHVPEILIIQLKRFKSDMWGRQHKIDGEVDFPLEGLRVTSNTPKINKNENLYDLQAITNHHGFLQGGHYTAFAKSDVNNEWYEFDDSSVYHIPAERLKHTLVSREAYILYYVRRSSPEEDKEYETDSDDSDME